MNYLRDYGRPLRISFNYLLLQVAGWFPPRLKPVVFRAMGAHIGKGVFISPGVIIDPVRPNLVFIDDNVFLGWGARVFAHKTVAKQENGPLGLRLATEYRAVHIKEWCLIGGFATVEPGVAVHEHAIVLPNSVVTRDVPPWAVVGGVPARFIKSLT